MIKTVSMFKLVQQAQIETLKTKSSEKLIWIQRILTWKKNANALQVLEKLAKISKIKSFMTLKEHLLLIQME